MNWPRPVQVQVQVQVLPGHRPIILPTTEHAVYLENTHDHFDVVISVRTL